MGQCRRDGYDYEAVIGVGGISPWREASGIALKVNWVGVGPHRGRTPPRYRGPLVTFDRFRLFEETGPLFAEEFGRPLAQRLFRRMSISFFTTSAKRSWTGF